MAYVTTEFKDKVAPVVKAICKKYNVKGTIKGANSSTLTLTVSQGKIDFIQNFNDTVSKKPQYAARGTVAKGDIDVNPYWYHDHFTGKAVKFLDEVFGAMKGDSYYCNDDVMTDYFDRSHYIDVKIGKWNKPYALVK